MVTRISATPLEGSDHLIHLIGNRDESLKAVGKAFGVKIRIASEGFLADGQFESVESALRFFATLPISSSCSANSDKKKSASA